MDGDFCVVMLAAVMWAYQRDKNCRNMVFTRGNDAGVAELQCSDTFLAVDTI